MNVPKERSSQVCKGRLRKAVEGRQEFELDLEVGGVLADKTWVDEGGVTGCQYLQTWR